MMTPPGARRSAEGLAPPDRWWTALPAFPAARAPQAASAPALPAGSLDAGPLTAARPSAALAPATTERVPAFATGAQARDISGERDVRDVLDVRGVREVREAVTGRPEWGTALSVTGLAVAHDTDAGPAYTAPAEADGGGWDDEGWSVTGLLADEAGRPRPGLAVLGRARPRIADLALAALTSLGAPGGPEQLVLVQSGHDQEHMAMPLPRISHELPWDTSEDLALTHLEEAGGTAVFDLLGWLLAPGAQAAVVLADRPEFSFGAPHPTGAVVALRVGAGPGPLGVVALGGGRPPAADRSFTAPGPCGPWLDLHRSLTATPAVRGELLLLTTPGDPASRRPARWLLLRATDPAALSLPEAGAAR